MDYSRESEPAARPVVREFVIRHGKQGVFSHADEGVARHKLAVLTVQDHESGSVRPLSLWAREVTYEPLSEDHPQFDKENPAKVPTGEEAMFHPGTVKERKLT